MRRQVDLDELTAIHMRIDLRGRDVGMAKDLLQRAQVGAAGEHMRRERMAQHVGMQALDTHRATRAFAERMHALAREPGAVLVQEDRAGGGAPSCMGRQGVATPLG